MKTSLLLRFTRQSLLLVFCLAALLTHGASPIYTDEPVGIQFFKGSWSAVLAEAKKQNKPVFVDIYTTWCGPCKLMAKQAFPDAKVGGKFNANFINYQIDAEKGEGIDVAKKYAVTAYPTSLYVSGNGELLHRAVGYGGIPGMLTEADKAIAAAKDPNPVSVMDKQYADGKRDADFLRAYLTKRASIGMPNGEALEDFLATVPQADWESEKMLALIIGNLTQNNIKAFDVLLAKLPTMSNSEAKNQAMMNVQKVIRASFQQAVTANDEMQLERVIRRNEQVTGSFRPQTDAMKQSMANDYRMQFYAKTKNTVKYKPMAVAEASKLLAISADSLRARDAATYKQFDAQTANVPDSVRKGEQFTKYASMMKTIETQQVAMKLNGLAWTYFETLTDPADLKQAITWSARSLELERSHMLLDTYAQLLGKLGRKAEAIKAEQEAITLAKAKGEDTAGYEKTLAGLQK